MESIQLKLKGMLEMNQTVTKTQIAKPDHYII